MNKTILVTGGCGYIGRHCCVQLIQYGYRVVIVDNLVNSDQQILESIKKITKVLPKFYSADVSNENAMNMIFRDNKIDIVMHLAGFKSISESKSDPLKYYDNNVCCVVNLIKCMKNHKVDKIIFSSSASVYGNSKEIPINENCEIDLLNPYATTKFFSELILKDCVEAYGISCISLRYFNPVGSHSSGLLDESYETSTSNLFPIIVSIYNGFRERLEIFGKDYNTKDGTAIRDYICVEDLASGHLNALNYLEKFRYPKFKIFNLGTGKGYSVLEVIQKFELYTSKKLNWEFGNRRLGDPDILIADPTKARNALNFIPCSSLDYMVLSSIRSIKTFGEEEKNNIFSPWKNEMLNVNR